MPKPSLSPSSIVQRARLTARGSLPPAGAAPDRHPGPDGRDRRLIRQRLRRTRRVGDARVAELGLLVAELHAHGRWNSDLVNSWTGELEQARQESRALDGALRGERSLDELVAEGTVARCGVCRRLGGASDTYCAGCGRELPARSPGPAGEPHDGKTLTIR